MLLLFFKKALAKQMNWSFYSEEKTQVPSQNVIYTYRPTSKCPVKKKSTIKICWQCFRCYRMAYWYLYLL